MTIQTRLPFELDQAIDQALVAPHAGVTTLTELFRASGAAAAAEAGVPARRRRKGGSASVRPESSSLQGDEASADV
jgi:hypothetical protein